MNASVSFAQRRTATQMACTCLVLGRWALAERHLDLLTEPGWAPAFEVPHLETTTMGSRLVDDSPERARGLSARIERANSLFWEAKRREWREQELLEGGRI